MTFFKTLAEIVASLSVVIAWGYVAVTLPDPARAAPAHVATQATQVATQGESGSDQAATKDQSRGLIAQR